MICVTLFWSLAVIFGGLTLMRYVLSLIEIHKQNLEAPTAIVETDITVLQPILGGDPALEYCLKSNLFNAPKAHFIWLLDTDDEDGQKAAQQALAASGRKDVMMVISPPPPAGRNPKTYKLSCGLQKTGTTFVAVLDDDTVLPSGALGRAAAWAAHGTLVTGLPTYEGRHNFGSRLVSGFVNANSILTYLPAAGMKLTQTINGMFSLMRTEDIQKRGGFDAFVGEVTDDYALAQLFLSQEGRIKQTSLHLSITTTVESTRHYFALMRRWMVFAKLYLRENISLGIFALVLLPGVLPLPLVLAGLAAGYLTTLAAFFLLGIKALLARDLAHRLKVGPIPLSDLVFQITAELLLPLHMLAASIQPHHIRWRKRSFVLKGRRIVDG
jgi:ceramide glucosyltransferase